MGLFWKRMLAFALALALLCGALPASAKQDYPFSGFVTDNVPLKKSASASASALLTVPKGDAVYVVGEQSVYYIVQYEGKQGYIQKTYVSLTAVTIVTTQAPASEKASANYQTLYLNFSGDAVRALQQALAELGFYSGAVDAAYGTGTMKAVSAFQKANGLTETGAADASTQETLYEKSVRNASGKKTTVKTLPPIENYTITLGKKGDAVLKLKARLEELGYYTATSGDVYDAKTRSAVIAFQRKNGITANGKAGEATLIMLYSDAAAYKSATATPKATATPDATALSTGYPYNTTTSAAVILRKTADVNGARVTTVPTGAEITVHEKSGEFLKATYKTYTGYLVAAYVDEPAQYRTDTSSNGFVTLKKGDSGKHVTALMAALKELKFYSGAALGQYSTALVTAVAAFQRANGFSATGVMTAAQQEFLYGQRPRNSAGKRVTVKALPAVAGWPMASGDKGELVGELQAALKTLGYYTGAINNTYDAATVTAVKKFQKAKGLTRDGKAGEKTQTLLFLLAATPTPTPKGMTPTPAATEEPLNANNVIIMQNGTRGVAVKKLQARLVELGYYSADADGVYDSDDIAAVRAFQKKNGLKADGMAGLETQILLYSASALPYATATPGATASAVATATPSPTPNATSTPDVTTALQSGSEGENVIRLQERLKELGYYPYDVDGMYGARTAVCVRAFQKANNLLTDGRAGVQTLTALYDASAASNPNATATPTASSATPTPTPTADESTLKLNDTGTAVKTMQRRLLALGYLKTADGVFGPATFAAVVQFQQKNGLTVNGEVTSAVLKKINSATAVRASAATTATATPKPNNDTFTAPKASEVRYANWYTEIRTRARAMPDVVIYDPDTGLHYNLHMFSLGKHADSEPPTSEDTAIMNQVCGVNSWTPHAVWVIFSDGRVYMASTHSHGHTVDHTANNDLTGHVCLHFPRIMSEAEATGPYAVSHQNAILLGWEMTQAMIQ